MKQHIYTTQDGQKLLFCEFPKDATDIVFDDFIIGNQVFYSMPFIPSHKLRHLFPIPPGNWQLLGKASEIEDQLNDLLPRLKDTGYPFEHGTPDDFIYSLGLNPETTVVLKKQ